MKAAINGITIGYDDDGTGDDVLVLVHGHPFDRTMWRPQVEHFSTAGWRVIAADLRGYGESTVVPGVTPLDVFAADVAGLLDHLGVERVRARRPVDGRADRPRVPTPVPGSASAA